MELQEAFDTVWQWTRQKAEGENYGRIAGNFTTGSIQKRHYHDIEIFTYPRNHVASKYTREPDITKKTEVSITHYDLDITGNPEFDTVKTVTEYFYTLPPIETYLRDKWRILYWKINWRIMLLS